MVSSYKQLLKDLNSTDRVDDFLARNFEKIKKLPEFKDLPDEFIIKLLKDSKFLSDYGVNMSNLDKNAYPNYGYMYSIKPNYNLEKWIAAARELHYYLNEGLDYSDAFNKISSKMDENEKFNFKNWMKFYSEGNQMKYKVAQTYYQGDAPGYFISIKKDKVDSNNLDLEKITKPTVPEEEKRNLIEKQRKKLISRLDSVEKLLRTTDGHLFAGNELETLMEAIFSLKKKVSTLNKVSYTNSTYIDLIYKEANILNKKGFIKGKEYLESFAQQTLPVQALEISPANHNPSEGVPGEDVIMGNAGQVSPMTFPANGGIPGSNVGNTSIPGPVGPGAPGSVPTHNSNPNIDNIAKSKGMSEFLKGLEDGGSLSEQDPSTNEDNLEVEASEDYIIIREAQLSPPIEKPELSTPSPKLDASKPAISTPAATPSLIPGTSKFQSDVDNLFKNITIEDVLNQLEEVTNIFRTREIPRRLTIIDVALNQLGLASYFTGLSEAITKSFDSSNYILTRLEDINSKLRGATNSPELNLTPPEKDKPEVAGIKNKLKSDEIAEDRRKELRKQQENAKLENALKPEPEVNLQEGLEEAKAPAAPTPATPAPISTPAV